MKASPVITCMADEAKSSLLTKVDKGQLTPSEKKMIQRVVRELPGCPDGSILQVQNMGAGKGEKKTRAPTEYNIFLGKCMEGGNKKMKPCVEEWKQRRR